jgi:histidinol-phosphatase (PHP family)
VTRLPEPDRVAIHGCHSLDYCSHATDTLEDILTAYRDQGYAWVGVTEHMPVDQMAYLPKEEAAEGFTLGALKERIRDYAQKVAELKARFAGSLDVYFAFETEVYPGYEPHLENLLSEFKPEYIVGSVHYVKGIAIDSSPEKLAMAADRMGGLPELYCEYFDVQLQLIERFSPRVIGHFDLIRLYDPTYATQMEHPEVWSRIERNLEAIRDRNAILDLNLAAIRKGLDEPYPCERIVRRAIEMGIPLVPGEDAHGVEAVGENRERGIDWFKRLGGNCDWERPA